MESTGGGIFSKNAYPRFLPVLHHPVMFTDGTSPGIKFFGPSVLTSTTWELYMGWLHRNSEMMKSVDTCSAAVLPVGDWARGNKSHNLVLHFTLPPLMLPKSKFYSNDHNSSPPQKTAASRVNSFSVFICDSMIRNFRPTSYEFRPTKAAQECAT